MQLLHADYFEGGTAHFVWTLRQDSGDSSELDLPIAPDRLRSGMRVSVTGERSSARASRPIRSPSSRRLRRRRPGGRSRGLDRQGPRDPAQLQAAPRPSPSTFTQAADGRVVFSGASSIANYWSEASFGNQLMTGTVTPWLTAAFATPTTCDYQASRPRHSRLATAAGYMLCELPEIPLPLRARDRPAAGPAWAKCPARRRGATSTTRSASSATSSATTSDSGTRIRCRATA